MPKHQRNHPHHHRQVDHSQQAESRRLLPLFWIGQGYPIGRGVYPPGWVSRWTSGELGARVYLVYVVIGIAFLVVVFGCAALATLAGKVLSLL